MKKSNRILILGVLVVSLLLSAILVISFTKSTVVYKADFEANMGEFIHGGNAILDRSDEQSVSGSYSLKISEAVSDWHGARISGAKTKISLDAEYEISAMVYSETEKKVVMQITLKKADGSTEYKWLESPILRPGVWTKYSAKINLPSSEYKGIESISFENKTEPYSSPYYLDNVKITEAEKVSPLSIAAVVVLAIIALLSLILLFSDILSGKRRDALTGAYSRDIIERDLPVIISKALSNRKDTCLIMTDLDHFKSVNDTYGHTAGDIVLKNFSEIIQHCIRSKDWVSRYGGEEFLIFLFDTSVEDGKSIAERIRKKTEESPVMADGKEIRVTASFGVASLLGSNLKNAQDLIKCADQNLYTAKKSGRNRVC